MMHSSAYKTRLLPLLLLACFASSRALAVDIYTSEEARQEALKAKGQSGKSLKQKLLPFMHQQQTPAAPAAAQPADDANANNESNKVPAPGVQTPVAVTVHGSLAGQQATAAATASPAAPGMLGRWLHSNPKPAAATTERRGRAPCVVWINNDVQPKAVMLCVHGLGLHNGSYKTFGQKMADLGIPTYAVDVRGFGDWMKNRESNQVDFDYCLQDIHDTLKVLHRAHPNLPVFILGESMGGAIALRATAMYPDMVDGLISCVPSGDRLNQKRTELKVAWQLIHAPNKPFDIGSSVVRQASESKQDNETGDKTKGTDQALEQHWLNDEHNRKMLSAKELLHFQHFMNENHQYAKQIKNKPVLMVQGGDDALVSGNGTLELLQNIPVSNPQDVDLLVLGKAKHLIFEESEWNNQALNAKVVRFVNTWIDDHLKNQTTVTQAPQAP
jgi:alpha-beta hydrolase superfamily lysophospholipase